MFKLLKLIICFIFSILVPKSKKILVFGDRGGIRFTDNSRYLFFYYNYFIKSTKCIWLTRDYKILNYIRSKGLKCYYSNSLLGLYYGLRASWHIFNYSEEDTSIYSARFRKNINLFHGTAVKFADRKYFKKKNYNSFKDNVFKNLNKIRFKISKCFFVFANSNKLFIPWISWKDYFPENKCSGLIVSNLQRNIMVNNKNNLNLNLFRTDEEVNILKKINKKNKKIIGYFPTFRFGSKELFIDIDDENKFKNLNNFLEKNNSIMIIKKHQNSYSDDKNKFYNPKFDIIEKLDSYENFYTIGYDVDLASIMSCCDIIISDYSSLIMDFLFLNRAIILYTPDFKTYSKSPGLALNIHEYNFFYSANNFDELNNLLKEYFNDRQKFNQKHINERLKLKNKIFENEECFKPIIEFIEKY